MTTTTGVLAAGGTDGPPGAEPGRTRGVRIDAAGVGQHAGRRALLTEISLSIGAGELVAIAGGSGAGKTTLLGTLAGLRAPSRGTVRHDGVPPVAAARAGTGRAIGYVPQDDIIHQDLPLRRTLRYAARLRLPAGTSAAAADAAADEVLRDLDLADRAEVPVRLLSGGQRKRASIAVELLARPRLLLLDEPTSGLDPATTTEVLGLLRRIAASGATVVLTTHDPAVLERCDRLVLLARGGRLAFDGAPALAPARFAVRDLVDVYVRLAEDPDGWADAFAAAAPAPAPAAAPVAAGAAARGRPAGGLAPWHGLAAAGRAWWVLTRRNVEVMTRGRLTAAVLVGSPLLVTVMMATLFRPGAFTAGDPASLGPAQTVFWIAFAGFFFGLTYGLLQIVGELAVFRRERLAGLSIGAYVAAKIAALLPVLAAVSAILLGVLRATGRLPAEGAGVYLTLFAVLLVEALSALALGLLASAAVANTAQAALALPMLCFPQVLFAGAVVPTDQMAAPGRAVGAAMATRHAFEALGRVLGLDRYAATVPAMAGYRATFVGGAGATAGGVLALALSAVLCAALTGWVLHLRTRPGAAG